MTYRIDKDENGEEALIMAAIVRNKTVDLDWRYTIPSMRLPVIVPK